MAASDSLLVRGAGAAFVIATCLGCLPPEEAPPEPTTRLICDRDYLPTFEDLVEGAVDVVHIAQWEMFAGTATDQVLESLADAAARGVHVRVLLDETIEDNADAVERLDAVGVEARLDTSEDDKLHVKLIIADDSALVGSTNWSTSAIDYNSECNLLLTGVGGPAYLDAWYDDLWTNPRARLAPDVAQTDETTTALVDDDLLESLVPLIDSATSRIDFTLYATYLQPQNLGSPAMQVFGALGEAAGRGVDVRGVADWSDWNSQNNESNIEAVDWLEARGVQMRWDRPSVNMHAKAFGIDDTVQIQSANVSTSGFEANHEGGARTTEPTVVADFDAWFEALWSSSTEQP